MAYDSAIAAHVPSVQRCFRFQQQHVDFILGHRLVLHTARHDQELAFVEVDLPVTVFRVADHDLQPAFHHQEELVLILVVVPDELAFELGELDVLIVKLAHDFRTPIFGEEMEFTGEVGFLHRERLQNGGICTISAWSPRIINPRQL